MSEYCPIEEIISAQPIVEGAGVKLNRVFGYNQAPKFDPFLLLDDFGSDNPDDYMAGFPWHPHRGIETVTYMLDGLVEHGDSLGNDGVIKSGEVQWMTAGSGIIHQEMPQRFEGRSRGFQLWVNLPKEHKMMKPRYREIKVEQIPMYLIEDGIKIKVIAGTVGTATGPVKDLVVDVEYLDITLNPDTVYDHAIQNGYHTTAYVVDGLGYLDPAGSIDVTEGQCVRFGEGDAIAIRSGHLPFRILLVSGKPLDEPIAWGGPIVMNTREEVDKAFAEYRSGDFIKE